MLAICTKFLFSYLKFVCLIWFIQLIDLVLMCFTVIIYSNICNCFVFCSVMEKIQINSTITTRCKLKIVYDVYEKLDINYKNNFKKATLDHFLDWRILGWLHKLYINYYRKRWRPLKDKLPKKKQYGLRLKINKQDLDWKNLCYWPTWM